MPKQSVVADKQRSIIDLVEQGKELTEIIDILKLGVTPAAISNKLANNMEYRQARVRGLEERLSQREREMELTNDNVGVSRARELLKLAQWKLERLASDVYGNNQPKVEISIGMDTSAALEHDAKSLVAKIRKSE
jgi:hypothetical protein